VVIPDVSAYWCLWSLPHAWQITKTTVGRLKRTPIRAMMASADMAMLEGVLGVV